MLLENGRVIERVEAAGDRNDDSSMVQRIPLPLFSPFLRGDSGRYVHTCIACGAQKSQPIHLPVALLNIVFAFLI